MIVAKSLSALVRFLTRRNPHKSDSTFWYEIAKLPYIKLRFVSEDRKYALKHQ